MRTKNELVNLTKDYYSNLDKTSNLQQAIDIINDLLESSAKGGFRLVVIDIKDLISTYLINISLNDFRRLSVYYRLQDFTVKYKASTNTAEMSISWIQ